MEQLNVVLADNQALTRTGIQTLLKGCFGNALNIKESSNKEDLLELLRTFHPNVLVLDYEIFDFTDINELRDVRKNFPATGILIVTDNKTPGFIMKIVDCGITTFVLKSCESNEFLEAFNAAMVSKKFFSNEILEVILEQRSASKNMVDAGTLTTSEIAIVKLITQGLTTKEIASQKNLSFHTIITHRKNIFRKLGISNSSELLMYAMRSGIIDTTEYYI